MKSPAAHIEVGEGDEVMLECEAEGDPIPTIQWDKDSRLHLLDPNR